MREIDNMNAIRFQKVEIKKDVGCTKESPDQQ